MSPESRARVARMTEEMLDEMRRAGHPTPPDTSDGGHVDDQHASSQAEVSTDTIGGIDARETA